MKPKAILLVGSLAACALLVVALASAGCGGSNSASASTAASASTGPVAGKVLVLSTQTKVSDEGPGDETIVGDVEQWRNVVWIFDQKSSDPRLTGTVETRYSVDLRPDGSGELWGTLVIRNDEGTWEGDWTGTIARGGTTHYILGEASGTGAYKGLTYHLQGHFLEKSGEGFAPGTDVVISGWIEKAE
jgi:hypothetical protein